MASRQDAALNFLVIAMWVFLELYRSLVKLIDSWLFKHPRSSGLHAASQDVPRKSVPAWIPCPEEAWGWPASEVRMLEEGRPPVACFCLCGFSKPGA